MKHAHLPIALIVCGFFLSACADQPLIMWHDDELKPAYGQGSSETTQAASRAPLDVPPDLRGEVEVPSPGDVAITGRMPARYRKAVTGQAVGLDARVYEAGAARVFSAVVDAMTALNQPVQSVDSPSGTITTEWVRDDVNSPSANIGGMFGGGAEVTRYRFVVRVLRMKEDADGTRLEVRTLGQAFIGRHWVNKTIKRKVADELFAATEEQLARTAPPSSDKKK